MNVLRLRNLAAAALAAALLLPGVAQAERYRVDLIVFADRSGTGGEGPRAVQAPALERSAFPSEAEELRAAGIEILPDSAFGLGESWTRLRNSRNHQPLLRLAWLQKDPPAERGLAIRLRQGNPFSELSGATLGSLYPLDGTVALRAGRFLHFDADLVWTQSDSSGDLSSYRLEEKRRVKRDELHHLDSPRLGVLARVQRVDAGGVATPSKSKKR